MPDLTILGDSPTTEDALGFDIYAKLLSDAIRNFDTASSLTIGIHGSWGSGKTSLMRMLEKRFDDDNAVKTIWFNAWAQGEGESIGLALLYRVLREFENEKENKEKVGFLLAKVVKLIFDVGSRKMTGITIAEAQEFFKDSIEIKNTLRDDFEAARPESWQNKKLVVFIDDLDRCLPEKTIEILEVIKLFLDVPKCIFVIGVAKEMIELGIEARYKTEGHSPISGRDYIEKIIQVPFTLPPISNTKMKEFIKKLSIGDNEERYSEIVARGTGCNPRRVKMFLNILRLKQEAAANQPGEELTPELFAKLFVIEYTFPDFYSYLVKYYEQKVLCKAEQLAKGELDRDELKGSVLQEYYKNVDLRSILENAPFFCGHNIKDYIFPSGKPLEEAPVFDESILEELLSRDPVKSEHALSTIKKIPDAVDRIITRLKGKDEIERRQAVEALGIIGDTKAVDLLIEILTDTDEKEVLHWKAAKAIGKFKEAAGPLIGILLENEDLKTRELAAMALGDIGDPDAVGPLIQVLEDENEVTRTRAAEALGKIGDKAAIGPLTDMAMNTDETERVRYYAKEALKKC